MFLKATKISLNFLLLVLVLDPSDLILHLKIPLFVAVFLFWLLHKIITNKLIQFNRDILLIGLVLLLIPLVGIISGMIQGTIADSQFGIGVVKSFSLFLLIIVLYDLELPFPEMFNKYVSFVSIFIIAIYFTFLISPNLFARIANYLVDTKDEAAFATRNYYGVTVIMMYYRTSALLVFPLATQLSLFFRKRKMPNLFMAVLCFSGLFLSGTRGNIVAGLIVLFLLSFDYLITYKKYIKLFFYTTIVVVGGLFFISGLSFQDKDQSEDIKSGHMKGYEELFNDKPSVFLVGEGLGSRFYSYGSDAMITQSELTYVDLLRIFGIPLTLLMLLIMIYPLIYLFQNNTLSKHKPVVIAYLGYLFIIGTNPLFISSTGIVVLTMMYSLIKRKQSINKISDKVIAV